MNFDITKSSSRGSESKLWQLGIFFVAVIMVSSSVGYLIGADGPTGFGTVIEPGSMVEASGFTIFVDDGVCYAKNGTTGSIDYHGTNLSEILFLIDSNSPGSRIEFSSGTFTFEYPVIFTSSISIIGAGMGYTSGGARTVLTYDGPIGSDAFTVNSGTNVGGALANFDLVGTAGHDDGLYLIYATHFTVEQLRIRGFGGDGININGSVSLSILDCNLRDNQGFGINESYTIGSFGVLISNCLFERNYLGGIHVNRGSTTITQSTFENDATVAAEHIHIHEESGNAADVIISDCVMATTGGVAPFVKSAISIVDATSASIRGCIFNSNANAINITHCHAVSIVGNTFQYSSGWRIYIEATTYNKAIVSSNQFDAQALSSGGGIFNKMANSIISDNYFAMASGSATYKAIHNAGSSSIIAANQITNAPSVGIYNSADDVIITANKIQYAVGHGIHNTGQFVQICKNDIFGSSYTVANTYSNIFNSGSGVVDGNVLNGFSKVKYNIEISGAGTSIFIDGNWMQSAITANVLPSGAILGTNVGWVTQNSGTATITTSTSVVFNHGLATTPTLVLASFSAASYGNYTWTATTTQITITVSTSGTYTVYWYAEV